MNTKAPFRYERYYHIYNRTHDGVKLFLKEENYSFFLQRYRRYLHPFVHIHAYALMRNHFHFSVAVKSKEAILHYLHSLPKDEISKGYERFLESHSEDGAIHDLILSQHQRFFISYSKAYNKAIGRVGGLFKRPFKHSHFDPHLKFKYMQYYLHHNARKHGIVKDFSDYSYTSYHKIIAEDDWLLDLEGLWRHWGNKQEFVTFHETQHYHDKFEGLLIEG